LQKTLLSNTNIEITKAPKLTEAHLKKLQSLEKFLIRPRNLLMFFSCDELLKSYNQADQQNAKSEAV